MGHKLKAFLILLVAIFITFMPISDVDARIKRPSASLEARLRDAYWWTPLKDECRTGYTAVDSVCT